MKIKLIILLSIFLPQLASAEPDNRAIIFNIGVTEGWKVTPEATMRRCDRLDPEGSARRDMVYQDWLKDNENIIRRVNQNTEAIIPVIMSSKNLQIDPVKAVRGYILIEALKPYFLGKSDEEGLVFCKSYIPDSSPEAIKKVTKALAELDKWREENNVPLR